MSIILLHRAGSQRVSITGTVKVARWRLLRVGVLAITHGRIAKGEERVTAHLYFKFEEIQLCTKVRNLPMGSLAAGECYTAAGYWVVGNRVVGSAGPGKGAVLFPAGVGGK